MRRRKSNRRGRRGPGHQSTSPARQSASSVGQSIPPAAPPTSRNARSRGRGTATPSARSSRSSETPVANSSSETPAARGTSSRSTTRSGKAWGLPIPEEKPAKRTLITTGTPSSTSTATDVDHQTSPLRKKLKIDLRNSVLSWVEHKAVENGLGHEQREKLKTSFESTLFNNWEVRTLDGWTVLLEILGVSPTISGREVAAYIQERTQLRYSSSQKIGLVASWVRRFDNPMHPSLGYLADWISSQHWIRLLCLLKDPLFWDYILRDCRASFTYGDLLTEAHRYQGTAKPSRREFLIGIFVENLMPLEQRPPKTQKQNSFRQTPNGGAVLWEILEDLINFLESEAGVARMDEEIPILPRAPVAKDLAASDKPEMIVADRVREIFYETLPCFTVFARAKIEKNLDKIWMDTAFLDVSENVVCGIELHAEGVIDMGKFRDKLVEVFNEVHQNLKDQESYDQEEEDGEEEEEEDVEEDVEEEAANMSKPKKSRRKKAKSKKPERCEIRLDAGLLDVHQIVLQAYTCAVEADMKYIILMIGNIVYFLRRTGDGDTETVEISRGFDLNQEIARGINIFHLFDFVSWLCEQEGWKRERLNYHKEHRVENTPPDGFQICSPSTPGKMTFIEQMTTSQLKLNWVIKEDDCQSVILSKYKRKFYYVKIANNQEGEKRLMNEVEIYKKLKKLQNYSVPRLEMYGNYYWNRTSRSFFLALEYSGGKLLDEFRNECLDECVFHRQLNLVLCCLDDIHKLNVLHCDIRLSNIIFHESFRLPYIIDFEYSKSSDDSSQMAAEKKQLNGILFPFQTPFVQPVL